MLYMFVQMDLQDVLMKRKEPGKFCLTEPQEVHTWAVISDIEHWQQVIDLVFWWGCQQESACCDGRISGKLSMHWRELNWVLPI
jgi:hypothetical protein